MIHLMYLEYDAPQPTDHYMEAVDEALGAHGHTRVVKYAREYPLPSRREQRIECDAASP